MYDFIGASTVSGVEKRSVEVGTRSSRTFNLLVKHKNGIAIRREAVISPPW